MSDLFKVAALLFVLFSTNCFASNDLLSNDQYSKYKSVKKDLSEILGLSGGEESDIIKFKNSVRNTTTQYLSQDFIPPISVSYSEAIAHKNKNLNNKIKNQAIVSKKYKSIESSLEVVQSDHQLNETVVLDDLEPSKTKLLYSGKNNSKELKSLTDIDWTQLDKPFNGDKDKSLDQADLQDQAQTILVSRKFNLAKNRISDLSYFASHQNKNNEQLSIQIIDDRSRLEREEIYPAKNLVATIPGTAVQFKVNHLGSFKLPLAKQKGQLMLHVDDLSGKYMPTVLEVDLNEGLARDKKYLRVMRKFYFQHQAAAASLDQDSTLSSWCGNAVEKDLPRAGVRVELDIEAQGPYYFGSNGIIDVRRKKTNNDGRFCFFNINSGLSVASFDFPDHNTIDTPIHFYAEKHLEKDFAIKLDHNISVDLAVQADADQKQSQNDSFQGRGADLVESKELPKMDLIPLGHKKSVKINGNIAKVNHDMVLSHSSFYVFASAPELEPAIYDISSKSSSDNQTILLPRGYVDDLALAARVRNDSRSGNVFVQADTQVGTNEDLTFRLVDSLGYEVGQQSTFSLEDKSNGVFFNVPSGKYQLLVETKMGQLVATKTALVYDEATTVAQF